MLTILHEIPVHSPAFPQRRGGESPSKNNFPRQNGTFGFRRKNWGRHCVVCSRVSMCCLMNTCVLTTYCVFHGYCVSTPHTHLPLTGRGGWKFLQRLGGEEIDKMVVLCGQWLKFGVNVVRGWRGGVLSLILFVKIVKYMNIVSRGTPLFVEIKFQEKVPGILAKTLSYALQHHKFFVCTWPRKILSRSLFSFPFLQNSLKKEWVIPQFPFPQDWREWPTLLLPDGSRPARRQQSGTVSWVSSDYVR